MRPRKHGPCYDSLPPYRDWLRDEFDFRCVYCLLRERWGRLIGEFDIEHWLAQINNPELGLDYDNLSYTCHTCNLLKGSRSIPDPAMFLSHESIEIETLDGSIRGKIPQAVQIIEMLGLDSATFREWRLTMIRCIELAEQHDPELYRRLMGFPSELPDLSKKKPRENKRPNGVEVSWKYMEKNGDLPSIVRGSVVGRFRVVYFHNQSIGQKSLASVRDVRPLRSVFL